MNTKLGGFISMPNKRRDFVNMVIRKDQKLYQENEVYRNTCNSRRALQQLASYHRIKSYERQQEIYSLLETVEEQREIIKDLIKGKSILVVFLILTIAWWIL